MFLKTTLNKLQLLLLSNLSKNLSNSLNKDLLSSLNKDLLSSLSRDLQSSLRILLLQTLSRLHDSLLQFRKTLNLSQLNSQENLLLSHSMTMAISLDKENQSSLQGNQSPSRQLLELNNLSLRELLNKNLKELQSPLPSQLLNLPLSLNLSLREGTNLPL